MTATTTSDLDPSDFFSDMDSGSLVGLRKTGQAQFEFEMQPKSVYGEQGSLMVWFHAGCNLSRVRVSLGDSLQMAVPPPHRLSHIRPVFSCDNVSWDYVPEPYGLDGEVFHFRVPLKPESDRVCFAAHFPYPSTRMYDVVESARQSGCAEAGAIGQTEQGRVIPVLRMGNPEARRRVLLSAGSHAGETASLWGMEGIIRFLTSHDSEAASLLRDMSFCVVPMLNVDGAALGLDRRQATGVNLYFDYRRFEACESRAMWNLLRELRPAAWLDLHSWHLGVAEGAYGPDASVIGDDLYNESIKPLRTAVDRRFPINNWGVDALDCPNTQALLQLGVPGLCPEFNMGRGADGRWKTPEDNQRLGVELLRAVRDCFSAQL